MSQAAARWSGSPCCLAGARELYRVIVLGTSVWMLPEITFLTRLGQQPVPGTSTWQEVGEWCWFMSEGTSITIGQPLKEICRNNLCFCPGTAQGTDTGHIMEQSLLPKYIRSSYTQFHNNNNNNSNNNNNLIFKK